LFVRTAERIVTILLSPNRPIFLVFYELNRVPKLHRSKRIGITSLTFQRSRDVIGHVIIW